MSLQVQQLTSSAISQLIAGDAQDEQIIVQIFNISKTKTGRLICFVSDGSFFLKAYCNDDSIIKPNENQNAIISIKSHGALKSSIGIAKMKLVGNYKQKIGQPEDWNKHKQNGGPLDNQHTPTKYTLDSQKLALTEKKTAIKVEPIKSQNIKSDQYQKIDDLYIGLKRFTLLCRITRKNLKESQKKGTKILEIQLVDKSKKKIIGTFFGDCATEFNDYLKEGSVYEISKGYIRQGNYNNSRNEMISPYTLVFDARSTFGEVSDFNIIVKSEDTAITLGQVYKRMVFHQQFDVVAYICQIKDQVTFQKNQRSVSIRDVIVADPEAQIMMSVKLWRWNQELPAQIVGKVVIFSRFALKENKGSIFLSSNMNSTIITTHNHPMRASQGRILNTQGFKMTTQMQSAKSAVEQNPAEYCYNTKQLHKKIEYMGQTETIVSMLNCYVSRFAFSRKWCYEACPKCNKAAEKYNKCANCDYAVEDTNLKFVLGVQISDFSGSLWITAYDQFAKKIFNNMGKNPALKMQELDKQQLSQVSENYCFQFFRIKIHTKKDSQGRIKHSAAHLYEPQQQKIASENMRMIHNYLSF